MSSPIRMLQLDALRGVAVLAVLVHHAGVRLNAGGLLNKLDAGHLGVELFFVLSGYLITGILLGNKASISAGAPFGATLRRFYRRRFSRIAPVYYATVLVLLVVDFEQARELSLWLVSYTLNIVIALDARWPGHLSHFWSLAVEQQFYLVWPWLVLKVPSRWLPAAIVALGALGPLARLAVVMLFPGDLREGGYTSVALPALWLDGLGAGALLAWFAHQRAAGEVGRVMMRRVLPLAVAGGLILLLLDERLALGLTWFVLGDLPMAGVFAALVGVAAAGAGGLLGWVLELRPLIWLGEISYGIYLFHLPVLACLLDATAGTAFDVAKVAPSLRLALCAVPSIVLAALSHRYFESPVRAALAGADVKTRQLA